MRVKQITGMPLINHNRGPRSLRLVDNYPNQLNKTISDNIYDSINYPRALQVQYRQELQQDVKKDDALLTMRTSIFNTTLMMMKRILLRIWSFTKSTVFFIWAVFRFMYSALEFMVLFVKFLFTQKHWSN
ncbi:hypothetical protein [Mucilaginibacter jinjuensis]|uniref:Uncharacterized protein n=1 Tax=Mucilaginibacter jinjuensis TaxID=1176721 RepID=A0ABY7T891_9SPHI|nr:hypothetical protein [Mucilaginibacter jinjuensis]WCT11892.1 hypothetical protein PQO05_24470 [Mucilaginibacter jinjuensis]